MILTLALSAWILALAVVAGLCVAAGRGDAALRRDLLAASPREPGLGAAKGSAELATGERLHGSVAQRRPEHDRGRGRVAVS